MSTTTPAVSLHVVDEWRPEENGESCYQVCECKHGDQQLGYTLLFGRSRLILDADSGFEISGDAATVSKKPYDGSALSETKSNCYSTAERAIKAAKAHHQKFDSE